MEEQIKQHLTALMSLSVEQLAGKVLALLTVHYGEDNPDIDRRIAALLEISKSKPQLN